MLLPILALLIVILLVLLYFFYLKIQALKQALNELSFSKTSQSIKYGKQLEQWLPFSQDFPYKTEAFRFIGAPIDGLVFDEDKIVFCEFKSNQSQLNEKQKKIKKLVQEKKVDWLEFKIE